jgi:hypothetical protein
MSQLAQTKEQTEQERAQLRIQAELFEGSGISLGSYVTEGEDRLIIGSSKRADLVVPHSSVSQIHAMLRITRQSDLLLYDLGSEGGTFVDGKKIVERRLNPGEIFEIGEHRVKVNLLNLNKDEMGNERAMFWKSSGGPQSEFLEMIRLETGIVREERTLSRNGRIYVGNRKNEITFQGIKPGEQFLQRKDSGKNKTVACLLPPGFMAEVYDQDNNLVQSVEKDQSVFQFGENEKAKILSKDHQTEILIFWRAQGNRAARRSKDADSPDMQRSMILCAAVAAILLAVVSYVPLKKEVVEEATIPKTSYYRLSMDSAPSAPAASQDQGAESNEKTPAPAQASKAASISSSISKLLNKKSTVTAESIEQAVSNNGNTTSRLSNIKNANMKSEEISSGGVGGGSVNVNAISAGLSAGGGGKAGSLKGFANGKGTGIGSGSGFSGKGFDMSLGGDEAEAIGGLDKALIAAVVQSNIGQIKHCYERQLIVDPNIFGKIVAQWTINKDGLVSTSSVKKTTMNSKAVENCILGKIKNWNFPKPKGGGQVIVSYPFLFKSLN